MIREEGLDLFRRIIAKGSLCTTQSTRDKGVISICKISLFSVVSQFPHNMRGKFWCKIVLIQLELLETVIMQRISTFHRFAKITNQVRHLTSSLDQAMMALVSQSSIYFLW